MTPEHKQAIHFLREGAPAFNAYEAMRDKMDANVDTAVILFIEIVKQHAHRLVHLAGSTDRANAELQYIMDRANDLQQVPRHRRPRA